MVYVHYINKLVEKMYIYSIRKKEIDIVKKTVMCMMMTILLLTMWIIPGYAAVEVVREPDAECAVSDAIPGDVDVLYEMSMRRDTSKPSSLWDLSSSSYRASGNIRFWTNTKYYFHPNSSGKIYVNASFNWGSDYVNDPLRGFVIYCYKLNGASASLATSYDVSGPTDSNGKISSGRIAFKNLDPNGNYYFQFEKTRDNISADLSATISHN